MTGTYEVPIEEGKIREFAMATKSSDHAYTGPDAIAPPTMLTIAQQMWEPPELSGFAQVGFDIERLLHGEEEYRYFGRLPKAGDRFTVSVRVADRYEKSGGRGGLMRFATIVHEFRDQHGDLIAEQSTTLVEVQQKDGTA